MKSIFELDYPCGGGEHFSRRTLLKAAGLAGITWLTPLADLLAQDAERAPKGKPARSVILIWLGGAPSQLETFDPHPGSKIAPVGPFACGPYPGYSGLAALRPVMTL